MTPAGADHLGAGDQCADPARDIDQLGSRDAGEEALLARRRSRRRREHKFGVLLPLTSTPRLVAAAPSPAVRPALPPCRRSPCGPGRSCPGSRYRREDIVRIGIDRASGDGRGDVAVDSEYVVRVVGALGAAEAFEVTAVGVGGTGGVVLGQLEVDVVAAGGERANGLPRRPGPRPRGCQGWRRPARPRRSRARSTTTLWTARCAIHAKSPSRESASPPLDHFGLRRRGQGRFASCGFASLTLDIRAADQDRLVIGEAEVEWSSSRSSR